MKSLFNYDNKIMQALMVVGDMIILNVLFLLCCLPIVTIGAAQAGLYTGIKVLMDKEDDSSCAAAFFRGLKSGFGRITAAYCIMLLIIALSLYSLVCVVLLNDAGLKGAPMILSTIALCICAIFQTLICLFHSRFGCTTFQLFRNAWLILLAHPLRSIAATLLTWLPVLLLFLDFNAFVGLTPLFLAIGFSFLFLLAYSLMRKPFQDLINIYNERNGIVPESTPTEETEEEEEYDDEKETED